MARRSTKRRPWVVGVIASRADLERAVRMRRPPDLFELRLDRLAGMADEVENVLPKLRAPLIITARASARRRRQQIAAAATAGSARSILESRRLYRRRVTLSPCAASLTQVGRKQKRPANHFIPQFQVDTRARESWRRKRARPNPMAQIFSKLLRALTRRWNSDVCSSSLQKPRGCSHLLSWESANLGRFHVSCWRAPARS